MITSLPLRVYEYANQQLNKFKSCELNNAITWNGITYLIQKIFYTTIVILLARNISPQEFKLWVTINSSIYLLLLWIEDGIAKSIPLYIHDFINKQTKFYALLCKLIGSYSVIYSIILLSYYSFNNETFNTFSLNLILTTYFFLITQGLIAILRPLFQALYLNKIFNTTVLISLLLKYITIIILIFSHLNITATDIIILNVIANIIVICISIYTIKHYSKNFIIKDSSKEIQKKSFVKHSSFMMLLTFLKSATNRNALTLIAAVSLGDTSFITYKIAQSSAILFYRFKIRAMGYNGLSLIAKSCNKKRVDAFNQVIKKLILLISPLLTFISLVLINFINKYNNIQDTEFIKYFLLISIFYTIYGLSSCYEKLLEVEQSYNNIIKAYIPYLLGVITAIILFIFNKNTFISHFFYILIIIHLLKLSSSIYIINETKKLYKINFPWIYLIKIIIISIMISILIRYLIPDYLIAKLIQ